MSAVSKIQALKSVEGNVEMTEFEQYLASAEYEQDMMAQGILEPSDFPYVGI